MPRNDDARILCQFRFLCDRQWNDLATIAGKPDVRLCHRCGKPVFRCTDYEQLAEHVALSHCVAIDATQPGAMLIGDPVPGYYGRVK